MYILYIKEPSAFLFCRKNILTKINRLCVGRQRTSAKITCCKFYVETLHLFQSNTAALRDTSIC